MAIDAIAELAERAVQLAKEDPSEAELAGTKALEQAVGARRAGPQSVALRALGLAAHARHQIPEALEHLREAVEVAQANGEAELATQARLSLASTLAFAGEYDAAMTVLDEIGPTGSDRLVAASQRAMILTVLGRYDEAIRSYRAVIPALRRRRDATREARARNNRGLLHVYTGRFGLADADIATAEQLMLAQGNATEAAGYCHNRGFVAARRGDLPTALARFEEADQRCREVGVQSGARGLDRAGALHAAGLVHEARATVEDALRELRDGANLSDLAEGLVLYAEIALLGGDAPTSAGAAEEAAGLFATQGRSVWRAIADAARARAALSQGSSDRSFADLATNAAFELDRIGLTDRATMAHEVAGRLWLAGGARDDALAELERASAARHRGTAAGRLAGHHAAAIAALARKDRRSALAALRAAIEVVSEQQASLGATELRAHVAIHAEEVAGLGLRLALSTDRPVAIWQWMERRRANSLITWRARPPLDEVLAAQLAELRNLTDEMSALAKRGGDPSPLLVRQRELERRIRERAWRRGGPGSGGRALAPVELVDVTTALGGAALVELAEIDGGLHAVVIADGRCHHRRLASGDTVRRELTQLKMALRRFAYGGMHSPFGSGAPAQLAAATAALDAQLLEPLRDLLGERQLVIVPTGELHSMPWAALPTLLGRTVTVVPSARLWLEATRRTSQDGRATPGPGPVVVVAGPRLPGALAEVEAVGALHGDAIVLTGASARSDAVLAVLEGAALAHVAAHASFNASNGLWSSLELADGHLTVYELEQLREPPRIVVLAACQSGLTSVHAGDEVMGLVAALLALGTSTVVASVVPVDDADGTKLMVELHRQLLAGREPAEALAHVQAETAGDGHRSYVCFGRG